MKISWPHALKLELRPCVQTDISIFHGIIPPIYQYRKNVIPMELNYTMALTYCQYYNLYSTVEPRYKEVGYKKTLL